MFYLFESSIYFTSVDTKSIKYSIRNEILRLHSVVVVSYLMAAPIITL